MTCFTVRPRHLAPDTTAKEASSKTTVTSLTEQGRAAYSDLIKVRPPQALTDAGHGVLSGSPA
ncbi:hypothetical protein [Streptomyces sp. NPDC060205]|uniref:hypothetical protein n=1 Tax=Streptomyces sp. NPDC060205 TaxID=3347072 RepID=UPI003660F871